MKLKIGHCQVNAGASVAGTGIEREIGAAAADGSSPTGFREDFGSAEAHGAAVEPLATPPPSGEFHAGHLNTLEAVTLEESSGRSAAW